MVVTPFPRMASSAVARDSEVLTAHFGLFLIISKRTYCGTQNAQAQQRSYSKHYWSLYLKLVLY